MSIAPRHGALAATLLLLGTAQAQIISPDHFSNSLGQQSPLYPIGFPTGGRMVQVHDDIPGNTTINQISFRPTPFAAGRIARSITVSVWVSNAATTSATIDSNFLANHGANRTQVVSNAVISLAAMPGGSPFTPGAFVDTIPFATPFFYNGVGSFCWEIEISSPSTPQVFSYDAFDSPNTLGSVFPHSNYGTGCFASTGGQGLSISMGNSFSGPFNGTISVSCAQATQNAPGAFFFGFDQISVPLPGTATGLSGLCTAYTPPTVSAAVLFDGLGTANVSFPVALSAANHGIILVAQAASLDAAANPFGLVTSDATTFHWMAPYATLPVSAVHAPFPGPTGTVEAGGGLVVELQ